MNMKRSKIYQLIQNLKDLRTKTSKARLSKQNLDKDDKEIIKPSEPKIFLKKHKAKKENKSKKDSQQALSSKDDEIIQEKTLKQIEAEYWDKRLSKQSQEKEEKKRKEIEKKKETLIKENKYRKAQEKDHLANTLISKGFLDKEKYYKSTDIGQDLLLTQANKEFKESLSREAENRKNEIHKLELIDIAKKFKSENLDNQGRIVKFLTNQGFLESTHANLNDELISSAISRFVKEKLGGHFYRGIKQEDRIKVQIEWLVKMAAQHSQMKLIEVQKKEWNKKLDLLRKFYSMQNDFYNKFVVSKINSRIKRFCDLSDEDLRLISLWSNVTKKDLNKISSKNDLYEYSYNKYDVTTMISARHAEKAAIDFYKEIKDDVKDCSIEQAHNSSSERWKYFDIEFDDYYIDVKNARRPFGKTSNYSEQYVKSFKLYKEGIPITYLGTLSEYKTVEEELVNNEIDVQILGELQQNQIDEVSLWISKNFDVKIDLDLSLNNSRRTKGNFIPGWMFEYSNSYYPNRNLSKMQALLKDLKELESYSSQKIETPIRIMADDDFEELSPSENKIIETIKKLDKSVGVSRRSLYLSVLAQTLDSINCSYYEPNQWKDILFRKDNNDITPTLNANNKSVRQEFKGNPKTSKYKEFPLFLYDSERYIFNLIEVLQDLWHRNKAILLKYESFRMTGPNILRGVTKEGRQETIIGYCGGMRYLSYYKGKCGQNPLYRGESEICNKCGYLICFLEDCQTCSQFCEENARRKEKLKY